MNRISEWWSHRSSAWLGANLDFEGNNSAIRALKDRAVELGLDPEKVIRLVRPKLFFFTSGRKYGPLLFLLPGRLRNALAGKRRLPAELHSLIAHGPQSCDVLVEAVRQYALNMAPAYVFSPREQLEQQATEEEEGEGPSDGKIRENGVPSFEGLQKPLTPAQQSRLHVRNAVKETRRLLKQYVVLHRIE